MKVIYDPKEGTPCRDDDIWRNGDFSPIFLKVLDMALKDSATLYTANDMFITAIRVAVKRGIIPHEDLQLHYDGSDAKIDADGNFIECKNLSTSVLDMLKELL